MRIERHIEAQRLAQQGLCPYQMSPVGMRDSGMGDRLAATNWELIVCCDAGIPMQDYGVWV